MTWPPKVSYQEGQVNIDCPYEGCIVEVQIPIPMTVQVSESFISVEVDQENWDTQELWDHILHYHVGEV